MQNGEAKRLRYLLLLAIALIIFGGGLAYEIQTGGGTIEVHDLRFVGASGKLVSALLYVPKGVDAKHPAPGILAIHGYINSRETQDGFAIEFARRGYVVLAPDQSGHGYSDPPSGARGFGGPDSLAYLRSLDIVDKNNIGLEGHSMGGWAVQMAAASNPEGYRTMVLAGSSTGTFGTPKGSPTVPRNLGLIFSRYDEFSGLMWASPIAADVVHSDKLKTVFGATSDVEVGKLYGDIGSGSGRMLYTPPTTHPQDHISPTAIGNAIDWMQRTLKGGNGLPSSDQTWYWKEFGTFIAFVGAALALFASGGLLLRTQYFSALNAPTPPIKSVEGAGWWLSAILTVAIPILTYFWLQNLGTKWFPASKWFPQTVTSGLMVWALGNALITVVLFAIWHLAVNRKRGATLASYGLLPSGGLSLSAQLAILIVATIYLALALCDYFFKIDFRFWVVALKLPSLLHLRIALTYFWPFLIFFIVQGAALHGQLRRANLPLGNEMLINVGLLITGFIVLLLIQYIPLFSGRVMPLAEPLLTIVAWQFVPLLALIACISTYFFRKTGTVYVGAICNALLVTGYIVAGQATQFAF